MKLGSKKILTCSKCGTTNLRWENNGRWVLFDPTVNMFHQCPVFKTESKTKKDLYAKAKAEIEAIPDQSPCGACVRGFVPGLIYNSDPSGGRCQRCCGTGKTDASTKKRMLADLRKKIWPNMPGRR